MFSKTALLSLLAPLALHYVGSIVMYHPSLSLADQT